APAGRERAQDVYAAALHLSTLPVVDPDHIAAMGFSHGGWTVLNAAATPQPSLTGLRGQLAGRGRLAAFVALYPPCRDTATKDFIAPLLILIGAADDWTPAAQCEDLADKTRPAVPELQLKVYPDAYHAFDENQQARKVLGHTLAYNGSAAA